MLKCGIRTAIYKSFVVQYLDFIYVKNVNLNIPIIDMRNQVCEIIIFNAEVICLMKSNVFQTWLFNYL